MDLQKEILERFMAKHKKPTLKFISQKTGIQMTRVFRILNGATMSVPEYEIFYQLVYQNHAYVDDFIELASLCQRSLKASAVAEIADLMKKKLWLVELNKVEN